ncbi:kelch domain-containing protein 2-like [Ruditapes philippinarum]|uniref:kelch domain-containing protein 2-like n=1 Tax=Ruditapes philippinarum TaxID=129788 RepID=UPI00295C103E|nr:kelch domain-containing protein 2-like [Ruditapes philippinarum]
MNATTFTFETVPPRAGHVAVAANDLMIVWGGCQGDYFSFREKYLPANTITVYHTDLDVGYWTEHVTEGDIPPGTSGASGLLIASKMYIFGGHTKNGDTNELYCLDLQQLTWKHIIPESELLPSPRDKFTAWSYNNKLYYFGGFGENINSGTYLYENGQFVKNTGSRYLKDNQWNNQLLVYDLESNRWSNPMLQGPVPVPRAAHTAVRLKNVVYLFGGRHGDIRMNDLHSLELETLTWSGELYVEGACPCGRSWHTFTAVSDEVIFLYGGYSDNFVSLSDAWQLNVTDRQWSQITMPFCKPREWHTAFCSTDGEILIFGGFENDTLKWNEPLKTSNEVLTLQLKPHCLKRLCLQTVYIHWPSDKWTILPKPLNDWLLKKKRFENTKFGDTFESDTIKQGSICVVHVC